MHPYSVAHGFVDGVCHGRLQRSVARWVGLGLLLALLALALPAHAQRVALVIGNARYQHENILRNPASDARLLESTLRAKPLAFNQVTLVSDADRVQLLAALSAFKRQAQGAEVALLYYSGHGMINTKRQNHILPIDMPRISANAALDVDTALEAYGVSEDKLIESIEGAKVQLAILDACRDNGFAGQKSGTKGLTRRPDTSRNRLLAYATEEGRTAEDGTGANSTYALSLAKHLTKTDWPLLKVFDEVASDVERTTRNQQTPTRSGNLRTDVYLVASLTSQPTGMPVQPDPDQEAWELAKKRDTVAAYQAYLDTYPKGHYADPARVAIQGLQPAQQNQPAVQPSAVSTTTATVQPGQSFKDCADCPEMVAIPAGSFTMGSSAQEQQVAVAQGASKQFTDTENPQHRVQLAAFALGKYEVSRGEFDRFVRSSGYRTQAERVGGCFVLNPDGSQGYNTDADWRNPGFKQADDHPVVCVGFNDIQAYVAWLSKQAPGKGYRLPSEAEWEYAARAGSTTAYPWGDDPDNTQICQHANHREQSYSSQYLEDTVVNKNCSDGVVHTAAGGRFSANAFGLHNMHGNVSEWMQDVRHDDYTGAPTDGSAWTNGGNQNHRMVRGGSWIAFPHGLRSAFRPRAAWDASSDFIGFRLARSIP